MTNKSQLTLYLSLSSFHPSIAISLIHLLQTLLPTPKNSWHTHTGCIYSVACYMLMQHSIAHPCFSALLPVSFLLLLRHTYKVPLPRSISKNFPCMRGGGPACLPFISRASRQRSLSHSVSYERAVDRSAVVEAATARLYTRTPFNRHLFKRKREERAESFILFLSKLCSTCRGLRCHGSLAQVAGTLHSFSGVPFFTV